MPLSMKQWKLRDFILNHNYPRLCTYLHKALFDLNNELFNFRLAEAEQRQQASPDS